MSDLKRHVGKIENTDRKCIVVYMQIPGKEDHALIIDADALPDRYHEPIMKIVESIEGQKSLNLADILSRRIMPTTGLDVLNTLHQDRFLTTIPVSNIIMYPKPNMPIRLTDLIQEMKKIENPKEIPVVDEIKYNPYENITTSENSMAMESVAKNLLVEASLLEEEAKRKRQQAYQISPHLTKDISPISEVSNKTSTTNTVLETKMENTAVLKKSKKTKAEKAA